MAQASMKHGDFTALAGDYARYRPGYAPSVLTALLALVGAPAASGRTRAALGQIHPGTGRARCGADLWSQHHRGPVRLIATAAIPPRSESRPFPPAPRRT